MLPYLCSVLSHLATVVTCRYDFCSCSDASQNFKRHPYQTECLQRIQEATVRRNAIVLPTEKSSASQMISDLSAREAFYV